MSDRVFEGRLAQELSPDDRERRERLRATARSLVSAVRAGLVRDGFVRLHGFGTFRLRPVAARRGRNPRTGEPIDIPAGWRVMFRPAKALRERVEPERAPSVALGEPQASREAMLGADRSGDAAASAGRVPPPATDSSEPRAAAGPQRVAASPMPEPKVTVRGPVPPARTDLESDSRVTRTPAALTRTEAANEPATGVDECAAGTDAPRSATTAGPPPSETSAPAGPERAEPIARLRRALVAALLLLLLAGLGWWSWPEPTTRTVETTAGESPAETGGSAAMADEPGAEATTAAEPAAPESTPTESPTAEPSDTESSTAESSTAGSSTAGSSTAGSSTAGSSTAGSSTAGSSTAKSTATASTATEAAAAQSDAAEAPVQEATNPALTATGSEVDSQATDADTGSEAEQPSSGTGSTPATTAMAGAIGGAGATVATEQTGSGGTAGVADTSATDANAADAATGETAEAAAAAKDGAKGTVGGEPYFAGRAYTVRAGDTLWGLAERHYVNPFYWTHIWNRNDSLDNPNRLEVRQDLWLPTLEGEPRSLTAADRRSIAEGYLRLYRFFREQGEANPQYALVGVRYFDPAVLPEDLRANGAGLVDGTLAALFRERLEAQFPLD